MVRTYGGEMDDNEREISEEELDAALANLEDQQIDDKRLFVSPNIKDPEEE